MNGLNVPTKRDRLTEWIQKQDPYIYMLSTRDPLQIQGHIQTESEGMEKDIPCKWKLNNNLRILHLSIIIIIYL